MIDQVRVILWVLALNYKNLVTQFITQAKTRLGHFLLYAATKLAHLAGNATPSVNIAYKYVALSVNI